MKIDLDKLRVLWAEDIPVSEIGDRLGCSRAYASAVALKIGLPRRAVSSGGLPRREIVRVYVDHGLSASQIVAQLRDRFPTLHCTTVQKILRTAGVIRPRGGPAVDRVAECVRMVRAGLECPEIGRRLGLTAGQVEYRVRKVMKIGRGRKVKLPVRAILSLASTGQSYVAIARSIGCSASSVGYHVRRSRRERVA